MIFADGATEFFLYDIYTNLHRLSCSVSNEYNTTNHLYRFIDDAHTDRAPGGNDRDTGHNSTCVHSIQSSPRLPRLPPLSLTLWVSLTDNQALDFLKPLLRHADEQGHSYDGHATALLPRFFGCQRKFLDRFYDFNSTQSPGASLPLSLAHLFAR